MKIAYHVVRVLLGLMFLFAAGSYYAMQFKLMPPPDMSKSSEAAKAFMTGMNAVVYLMPFVKVIELICGLLLVIGRFVPLATVMLFPIILNIIGFHAYAGPEELPMAIVLLIANLFLAYTCRKHYTGLLASKTVL
jgi:putative oxidoreductase